MFVVVSKWEFDPANREALEAKGSRALSTIKSWDGVADAYNVRVAENSVLAVLTYRDEATYHALIDDPNGPFARLAAELGLEDSMTWLWSERGERMD